METKQSKEAAVIAPVRFENKAAMVLAGFRERYNYEEMEKIPAQWARFGPRIGTVPAKVKPIDYGVVVSTPDRKGFDYLTVFEVSDTASLPPDFETLSVPAQRYAVFVHPGHVSRLCETIDAVFHQWLPKSGYDLTGNPDFLERYGEQFDPTTGTGDLEVWVPLQS